MEKTDTKPKAKKPNKEAQYERFVKTARELGVDENSEAFERAFAKIVPPKGTTLRR